MSALPRSVSLPWLLAATLLLAGCSGPAERPPRHLVLVSLDTARADHFGFLGSTAVKTPRLDALARESIVFTDAMTVVPTTLASHTSLFTGLYPQRHGTPSNGFLVNRQNEMLPELLQRAGFHTAGFAGSFALDRRFGFPQGFDHWDESFDVLVGEPGVDQNQRNAEAVNRAVLRYLDGLEVPERLFLFVHYFDPHLPYAPPAPFDRLYDAAGREGLPTIDELKQQLDALDPERLADVLRRHELQYAGEISYLDQQLGRLLDELERRGILDDALLVITSDHGETHREHYDRFSHGLAVYDTTLRSVLLLRLPKARRAGTVIERLVASIDVLPTVLSLLRLPLPERLDGEAIALDPAAPPPAGLRRFGQATQPRRGVPQDPRWPNRYKARCVREGRFKLIQTPYQKSEELYDLAADPGETRDLLARGSAASPSPEVLDLADRLRAQLEAWSAAADPLPSRFEPAHREETLNRLRALGYVEE